MTFRQSSFRFVLMAGIGVSPAWSPAEGTRGVDRMLSLEVKPLQEEYLADQEFQLNVRIANRGTEAVEIPDPEDPASDQPVYGIIGPQYPDGKTVHRAASTREGAGEGEGRALPEPARVRIEPGSSWEGLVPMSALMPLSMPGEYRIRAMLAWQGGRVTSQEQRFRLLPASAPVSVHLGEGTRPLEFGEGEGVVLRREANGTGVYVFDFSETHPGIGEMGAKAPIRWCAAGMQAVDAGVPWTNTPFFGDLIRWVVWREGKSIEAISNIQTQPISFQLPTEPAYLVRPPLKPAKGPLEVMAVSADFKELMMASFEDPDLPGKLAWRIPLPARPAGISAIAGPEIAGGLRYVAMAAKRNSGFDVFVTHYGAAARPAPFQVAHIDSGMPLGDSPLALAADDGGRLHVAIAGVEADGRTCLLAEVVFDASGKPMDQPAVTKFEPVEGKAANAAVFLVQSHGKVIRKEMVVGLEDKSLLRMGGAGGVRRISVPGTATDPIQLAPGARVTYILYFDPAHGLRFEKLPS